MKKSSIWSLSESLLWFCLFLLFSLHLDLLIPAFHAHLLISFDRVWARHVGCRRWCQLMCNLWSLCLWKHGWYRQNHSLCLLKRTCTLCWWNRSWCRLNHSLWVLNHSYIAILLFVDYDHLYFRGKLVLLEWWKNQKAIIICLNSVVELFMTVLQSCTFLLKLIILSHLALSSIVQPCCIAIDFFIEIFENMNIFTAIKINKKDYLWLRSL